MQNSYSREVKQAASCPYLTRDIVVRRPNDSGCGLWLRRQSMQI